MKRSRERRRSGIARRRVTQASRRSRRKAPRRNGQWSGINRREFLHQSLDSVHPFRQRLRELKGLQ